MHYLHTLARLMDKLAEGDRAAWTFFIGFVIILGIAFVYDFRMNKREDSSTLKQNTERRSEIL